MLENYDTLVSGERRGCWPALLRGGLRAASGPYSGAMQLRNWLYDHGWKHSYRAAVPVISVGNLTVGGTGKTPCVEYVAKRLRERDLRVAILSRGYGGYGEMGGRNDEALVLEENLPDVPHLQGPDRVALARIAVEELDSQVLLLDDGFQHRRLARDLDVVLVDATNPWGYGHLLPRGLLREGPRSLRRAHLVLLTRCDQVTTETVAEIRAALQRYAPRVPLAEAMHRAVDCINAEGAVTPLAALTQQPIVAFCGIGNPEAFRRTLLALGASIVAFRAFPDHHAYSRSNVDELRDWVRQSGAARMIVTTQKDLVKLRVARLGERELWALRVQLHVREGGTELDDRLTRVDKRWVE